MTEQEARQKVKEAGVKLLESNLVQGTWGNISIRLDDHRMVVTPSAMDYIRMRPEDTVIVDIYTLEYDSPIKPTSEKKIHAAIYRDRPDINAVIHSHPLWCSSVAAARKEMPVVSDAMQKAVLGSARVGAYGLPGTKTLTKGAVEALKGRNACFLANHGMFACATSIEEAFEVCKIMEESSRRFIERAAGEILGRKASGSDDIIAAFRKIVK